MVRGDTFFVLELEKQGVSVSRPATAVPPAALLTRRARRRSAARYRLSTPVRAERERWVEMLSRGIQMAEGDPPARYADSIYTGLESTPGEDEEENLRAADEALRLADLQGRGDGEQGEESGGEGGSESEGNESGADGEKDGEDDDYVPPEVPPHLKDFIENGLARLREEGRPDFEGWTFRGVESGVECYVNTQGQLASAMGRGEVGAPIRCALRGQGDGALVSPSSATLLVPLRRR